MGVGMALTKTICSLGGNHGPKPISINTLYGGNRKEKRVRQGMQRWVHSLGHPWPAARVVCARGCGVASTAAATALALALAQAPQSDTILDVLGSNVTLHVSGKPEIPLGEAWVLCLLLLSFAGTLVFFLTSGAVTARWIEKRLENRAVHLALLSETQAILQHACLQLLDHCVEKETERPIQVGDEDEDDEAFQKKIIWLMYQIEVQSSALQDLVSDNKEPTGPATASTVVWDAVNFIQRTLVHLLQELKNQVHKASIKPRDRRVLRHMGGRFDTMRKERAKLETLYVEGQVDRNYDDYHHPLWIKYLQSERNALENHPSWNHPSNQEEVPDSSDSSDNDEDAKGGL